MADLIDKQYKQLLDLGYIDNSLYEVYDVKRGLRNANGTGVLVGLTKISDVYGYKLIDGKKIADEGHLYYRDIDLFDLAKKDEDVFGFEKTSFLLLFGHLPNSKELAEFKKLISENYALPHDFVETEIMRNPSSNIMNNIQSSILALYTFDKDPDSQDPKELLRKGISIISKMPAIVAYSYQAKRHYIDGKSLHIHYVKPGFGVAEQILHLCRKDKKFTELEAEALDTALIVHAEHGGGNNSTFTNIVVSTSGTDIYSDITAGLGSLKGPRHGGASRKVADMMNAVIKEIGEDASDKEILKIVNKILEKKFFDKSGLIYGIGHAVYTKSDPRCILLKEKARGLAIEKHSKRFDFYERFEKIACARLQELKGFFYCGNVDFYSGLTYKLLGIPEDLYTPLFACARVVGWVAHIVETTLYCNKIIRPASKYVGEVK